MWRSAMIFSLKSSADEVSSDEFFQKVMQMKHTTLGTKTIIAIKHLMPVKIQAMKRESV
jgi:hypothetical protein